MPLSDRTFFTIQTPSPLDTPEEQIRQLIRQLNFTFNLLGGVIRSLSGEDGVSPTISANLNLAGNRIINLGDPVDDQDAATRAWVMNQQAEQDVQTAEVREMVEQGVGVPVRFDELVTTNQNYGFNSTTFPASAVGILAIANATTAPTGDVVNQHSYYSADSIGTTAGNACPTFRTELGDVIQLYTASALTAADNTVIDAVYDVTEQAVLDNLRLRVNELVIRLQTLGLLA